MHPMFENSESSSKKKKTSQKVLHVYFAGTYGGSNSAGSVEADVPLRLLVVDVDGETLTRVRTGLEPQQTCSKRASILVHVNRTSGSIIFHGVLLFNITRGEL